MVEFISNLIGNDFWATLVMSIFPLIELKGSIVFARGAGLGFFYAFALSYLGSTIVFIAIYFLLKPILNLLKKIKWFSRIAVKCESYCEEKALSAFENQKKKGKSSNMSETLIKQLGVFVFVAIPLPMTGVWTGTAIAVFLGLKFREVILPITLGNLMAGVLISLLAELCITLWNIAVLDYILYALFAIALILLAVLIVKVSMQKTQNNKESK
ncbi:MAG: small multi-drug export protein [Clostridia bacterium]|nr:small multi-drug export protein [Clostridia bacterium]